jgi:hypothetical protein
MSSDLLSGVYASMDDQEFVQVAGTYPCLSLDGLSVNKERIPKVKRFEYRSLKYILSRDRKMRDHRPQLFQVR